MFGFRRRRLTGGAILLSLLYFGIRAASRLDLNLGQQPRIVLPYVEVILRAPRPLSAVEQGAVNYVISKRLSELEISAQFSVVDDESMRLEIFQSVYDENLHPLFTEMGHFEFVDFSRPRSPTFYEDTLIWTTSLAENVMPFDTHETIYALDEPFETISDPGFVEDAEVGEGINHPYVVMATLRREDALALYRFTEDHVGDVIGSVLDGRVLDVFRIERAIGAYQGVLGTEDEDEAERTAALLKGGVLPTWLTVERTEEHCGSYCQ